MQLLWPAATLCWSYLSIAQSVVADGPLAIDSSTIANSSDGFACASDWPSTTLTIILSSNKTSTASQVASHGSPSPSACFHCRDDLDGEMPVMPEIVLPLLPIRNRRRWPQPTMKPVVATCNKTLAAPV
jgi:hypothetical protein